MRQISMKGETRDRVLETLQRNVGNPVSRKVLTEIYGKDERSLRNHIEALRRKGYRICFSSEERGGYYIAKTPAQYKAWRERYVRYAKAIFYTACCMDKQVLLNQESFDIDSLIK